MYIFYNVKNTKMSLSTFSCISIELKCWFFFFKNEIQSGLIAGIKDTAEVLIKHINNGHDSLIFNNTHLIKCWTNEIDHFCKSMTWN